MQIVNNFASITGRVALASIFVQAGVGKLHGEEATQPYIASAGLPLSALSYGVAVVVELVGGVLLASGVRSRTAAAVLAGFSITTAVAFHANFGDQNQMIHFLKNCHSAA